MKKTLLLALAASAIGLTSCAGVDIPGLAATGSAVVSAVVGTPLYARADVPTREPFELLGNYVAYGPAPQTIQLRILYPNGGVQSVPHDVQSVTYAVDGMRLQALHSTSWVTVFYLTTKPPSNIGTMPLYNECRDPIIWPKASYCNIQ